jgi:hypothetical protein
MTLQDFTKVKYNKKMKAIANNLLRIDKAGNIINLYDCYEHASIFKRLAYKECLDFYQYLKKEKNLRYNEYTKMQIISYNINQFTVAFILGDELYYITKNKKLYCEIA